MLLSLNNVQLQIINVTESYLGTPLEKLLPRLNGSKHRRTHIADGFRYIKLWQEGGIYLDVDNIIVKALDELPYNSACIVDKRCVNNSYMKIDNEKGKEFMKKLME